MVFKTTYSFILFVLIFSTRGECIVSDKIPLINLLGGITAFEQKKSPPWIDLSYCVKEKCKTYIVFSQDEQIVSDVFISHHFLNSDHNEWKSSKKVKERIKALSLKYECKNSLECAFKTIEAKYRVKIIDTVKINGRIDPPVTWELND